MSKFFHTHLALKWHLTPPALSLWDDGTLQANKIYSRFWTKKRDIQEISLAQ